MALTKTQAVLIEKMRGGLRLWWFGFAGPELEDHRFWPQARTVRSMLRAGVLRWKPWANSTQRNAAIRELEAVLPTDHTEPPAGS